MKNTPNVLFLGARYWCKYLSDLFNERTGMFAYELKDVKKWIFSTSRSVCFVGIGPPDTLKRKLYYQIVDTMYTMHFIRKKVIYWVGTDVMRLKENSDKIGKYNSYAGSPWLCEEVISKGYLCETRIFPVKIDTNRVYTWPSDTTLTVLCYVPDTDHALHGSNEIEYLARKFKEVKFNVLGGEGAWCVNKPNNINFLGWVDDIAPILQDAHVVLRRTKHDSYSAFVRQAIYAGRHVIFTYKVPYVEYVESGDVVKLERVFKGMIKMHNRGILKMKHIKEEYLNSWLDYNSHLTEIERIFNDG